MSLVHNERTKLLANAFDRASTACLSIGILAPIAAAIYSAPETFSLNAKVVLGGIIWSLAALVIHMSARFALRRFR